MSSHTMLSPRYSPEECSSESATCPRDRFAVPPTDRPARDGPGLLADVVLAERHHARAGRPRYQRDTRPGGVRGHVDAVLSGRRDRQRGADPVERLHRAQARPDRDRDRDVHRDGAVPEHIAADRGGGPVPAGRLEHHLWPGLPDPAEPPVRCHVRRVLRGYGVHQRRGGRRRRVSRRHHDRRLRLPLDLRADPGGRPDRPRFRVEVGSRRAAGCAQRGQDGLDRCRLHRIDRRRYHAVLVQRRARRVDVDPHAGLAGRGRRRLPRPGCCGQAGGAPPRRAQTHPDTGGLAAARRHHPGHGVVHGGARLHHPEHGRRPGFRLRPERDDDGAAVPHPGSGRTGPHRAVRRAARGPHRIRHGDARRHRCDHRGGRTDGGFRRPQVCGGGTDGCLRIHLHRSGSHAAEFTGCTTGIRRGARRTARHRQRQLWHGLLPGIRLGRPDRRLRHRHVVPAGLLDLCRHRRHRAGIQLRIAAETTYEGSDLPRRFDSSATIALTDGARLIAGGGYPPVDRRGNVVPVALRSA
ncbi:hypothetical protein MHPYR_200008 [uncultured Mycobacterium sp.]|uniref:Uncharacterized protein n=1 Tax=uncultured Mycobacterium sp. TaxID=171292 RepID=A0A1Y5PGM2_9MYCO|nr:hypothetical protein MHPYR_200008 [uncultured Mycobacterium sp.]